MAQKNTTSCDLVTNYFVIKLVPTKDFYQYNTFIPEVKSQNLRTRLFNHLQSTLAPGVFDKPTVYDGKHTIYSCGKLILANENNETFYVGLPSSPSRGFVTSSPTSQWAVKVAEGCSAIIQPCLDLHERRRHEAKEKARIAENLLRLVIFNIPRMIHTIKGQAYFSGKETRPIGEGLEVWRGIHQTIHPIEGASAITIDCCTTAVYSSGSLTTICMDRINAQSVRKLNLGVHDREFKALESFLKGLRVSVRNPGSRRFTMRTIQRLEPHAGYHRFSRYGEKEIKVMTYIWDAYGIEINPNIIGVCLSKPNAPITEIVPLEFCHVVPGQLYKGKIPERLKQKIADFSILEPGDRLNKIKNSVPNYYNSELIKDIGMVVDHKPLRIPMKRLEHPKISCSSTSKLLETKDGHWDAGEVHNPGSLTCWAVVNFSGEILEISRCKTAMMEMETICKKLGITTSHPYAIQVGNPQAIENSLNAATEQIAICETQRRIQNPTQPSGRCLIVAVLPLNGKHIRERIKHWGDIAVGIMTQCLRVDKIMEASEVYWRNVALKINARLLGTNFHVTNHSSIMGEISRSPFMIVGADVSHPPPGIQRPSVVGVVYSYDRYGARYAATTEIQEPRVEIIFNLKEHVKNALQNFMAANQGKHPERIFFFRDGASEGEFARVMDVEVNAVQVAIQETLPTVCAKVLLTFILVGKRHRTLFFPIKKPDEHLKNCEPGTVVESGITRPGLKEFYLLSHVAVQGASRSSRYVVLKDDNFEFNLGRIQELAFALCHVYAKAACSVSIPAPVYYADLVCSRGQFHLNPGAGFQFDDTDLDSSSQEKGSQPAFDMAPWLEAFKPLHKSVQDTMYFL